MIQETQKQCKTCEKTLNISNFWSSKNTKDGKRGSCKFCVNEQILKLKNQEVEANCQFQINDSCTKIYKIKLYEYNKNLKNNNGRYRCIKCAATETHLNKSKKYIINNDFFEFVDSEIKAYLLGIIAGDGHISKNYQYLEVVANKKDLSTLKLFKKYVSPNNKIRPHSTSENCLKITICSTSLCKNICNHLKIKSGKKSDKIVLPNLNKDLMIHFIRGLIDTDGWVKSLDKDNSRKCFYSSTSKVILEQLKDYLNKAHSIDSKINGIKLDLYGENASKFLEIIYNDANFYLKRKYDRFKKWSKL